MTEVGMEIQQSAQPWQVEVGGQIYDASFNELGEWIGEGSLQPEDKVRKGNLRWIEAKKVPGLTPFFNAKANGEPMPVVITTTEVTVEPEQVVIPVETAIEDVVAIVPPVITQPTVTTKLTSTPPDPDHCLNHPENISFYVCDACCSGFCKACPSSYGGSVKICPACGSMCKPVTEAKTIARNISVHSDALEEGFGIADFFNALAHPFRFGTSLFFGALMFAFFSIGQSASAIGGIILMAAALISLMLANMLTFGVLANTVENFAQGKLDSNFMPDFEDFSAWDDVVHPFFLSIAAYLVSFGPFILTALIGVYLVISSISSQMNTFQSEIEKLPGTQYYAGREPVEQSQQVKRVLGEVSDQHEQMIEDHQAAATGNANVVPQPGVDEDLEMWNQLQESRKKELEAAFGKTSETRDKEYQNMVSGLLSLAAPLVVVAAIAFLWGIFFYPAACAVAGYTRSFMATINPLVGLDTIKRLGASYVKILLMSVALLFISVLAAMIFSTVLFPFDLPGIGNIPAKILSSFVTFYLFAVFSCVLGYALFKNAHKLDLTR